MITIAALTANGQVVQHLVAPAVYLDHWALNAIARDPGLSRRFTAGLETHGGTLVLSWANLGEFTQVQAQEQVEQAEQFLEANLPRVYCMDVSPFEVTVREGRGHPTPAADDDLLAILASIQPNPPRDITASGLFAAVSGNLDDHHTRLGTTFVERYRDLYALHAAGASLESVFRKTPKSAATGSMLREIIASFLVDRTWRVEPNDAMDFHHAVVPSVYCQWVVLDKDWAAHVARAQRALQRSGASQPMATIVSKRAGIDRLIDWLESRG